MNSVLSFHVDNDYEHIDRLFPKCKKRNNNNSKVKLDKGKLADNDDTATVMDNKQYNNTNSSNVSMTNGRMDVDESSYEISNEDDESEEEVPTPPIRLSNTALDNTSSSPSLNNNIPTQCKNHLLSNLSNMQYKLRDSRIIEIAGGREVYSESKSKTCRKIRALRAEKVRSPGRVWELRASRARDWEKSGNSMELTETVFDSEIKSVKHDQTAPGLDGPVIFDDIDENDSSDELPNRTYQQNSTDLSINRFKPEIPINDGCCILPEVNVTDVNNEQTSENGTLHVIGSLPIAQYEASPRKYGDRSSKKLMPSLLSSPTATPPRPGFPQRVTDDSANNSSNDSSSVKSTSNSSFNFLYEYSETRKVLEEFFKTEDNKEKEIHFQDLEYELKRRKRTSEGHGSSYVGLRLAEAMMEEGAKSSPRKHIQERSSYPNSQDNGSSSNGDTQTDNSGLRLNFEKELLEKASQRLSSPDNVRDYRESTFTISPETTDCESCGEAESETSSLMLVMDADLGISGNTDRLLYPCMPILEDGLSSGHNSDSETNNPTMLLMKKQISEIEKEIIERSCVNQLSSQKSMSQCAITNSTSCNALNDIDISSLDPLGNISEESEASPSTPPPPAPISHRECHLYQHANGTTQGCVEATLKDIRMTLQRTKTLPVRSSYINSNGDNDDRESISSNKSDPVWVPRRKCTISTPSGDEDEADTDLETDRLLGQQRTDDQGFFDEKMDWRKKSRTLLPFGLGTNSSHGNKKQTSSDNNNIMTNNNGALQISPTQSSPPPSPSFTKNENDLEDQEKEETEKARNKEDFLQNPSVLIEGVLFRARYLGSTQLVCEGQPTKATRLTQAEEAVSRIKVEGHHVGCSRRGICGNDLEEMEELLGNSFGAGSLFRLRFLGSVEVNEEEPIKRKSIIMRKRLKKTMVEEAVNKIKAPDGESQPSAEVDLFISTEKIMVLNTDLKEIMMDHALRTISYIADIGDLVVLMARRRIVPHEMEESSKMNRTPKMICHVFESVEAQYIAQSIGQAFQVAYMEFLKANGIEDQSFVKEMDYQEVLNSQEIFSDELQMFAKKELQKEVVVPKMKGEILGVVIVESGWGSMLPTVVIANLAPAGAAARCGLLNIGDQIIAVNGVSLVGLPLSTCQNYIKNSKQHTVMKLTVVPCAPVVEVKIKRPDTKYQLGFSVQNGVICSLLRGGIAERGGVRVGHRIIEINNQSVVAVPHEKIVTLLATSVGEISMKTMPTSMFRLLTGQETPVFI